MDSHSLISSEDEKLCKYLYGSGNLRQDVSQSTVSRIVERIIPLLTSERLRVGKLIPFLEKWNVIAPDSLANLKTQTEQVESICDVIVTNQTPHTLFNLYASLSESGKEVPIHYQLACDIRDIIQSECKADDFVDTLREKGLVHSQSSAEATCSPNNTQEITDKSCTNSNEEALCDITVPFSVQLSSCNNVDPQWLVPVSAGQDYSLSRLNSTTNSLSSVEENSLSSATLSEANDFGASFSQYQYQFSTSSEATGPIELCDPNLLSQFNNPNESDLFALLVQTGANVNLPTNQERFYLLHLAIGGGTFDKVQVLLQCGADPNVAREDGRTPLHLACEQQLIEFVRLLVEHGANVNAVDNNGMACLHLKNTLQKPEIVKYLIENGATVDIATKDGFNTPLGLATGLLDEMVETVAVLLEMGALPDGLPQSAMRPLVATASKNHLDTLERLLLGGADINIRNKDGMTALMAAVLGDHTEVVQFLLNNGADLSCIRSGPYTISGNIVLKSGTALSDAAYLANLPLVKLLNEKGAKLTALSSEENAPIIFAVMGDSTEVVEYILCNGEPPYNELLDAIVAAVKLCHDDCASILLQRCANKNTLLEAAKKYCTEEHMEKLLKLVKGLGQKAHTIRVIEILHEFAQVCLQAALNYKNYEWLVDHAKKFHLPQLAEIFAAYYIRGDTLEDVEEFCFQGDPSPIEFLIRSGIISKMWLHTANCSYGGKVYTAARPLQSVPQTSPLEAIEECQASREQGNDRRERGNQSPAHLQKSIYLFPAI